MTKDEMAELQPGDLVRHESGDGSFVVTANYRNRVTAVRTADLTNPAEWHRVRASLSEEQGEV